MTVNHSEPRGKKERCCSHLIGGNVGNCNSETNTLSIHFIFTFSYFLASLLRGANMKQKKKEEEEEEKARES